jgi:hypothetical protein
MWLPISLKTIRRGGKRSSLRDFDENQIKTILPSYSAIASSDKYQLRIMKEKTGDFQ